MAIYTYFSNRVPGDNTAALNVASGVIGIGEYGEFTTAEYNLLSQHYDLRAGIVVGAPVPSFPIVPGHSLGGGPGVQVARDLAAVYHDTNADIGRPSFGAIMWIGSVTPSNALDGDILITI